jgi:hypothetical protein
MLRTLYVVAAAIIVLAVGGIPIPLIAQEECPPGYPVDCGTYCCEAGSICVGGGCCDPGFPVFCGEYCCKAGFVCCPDRCCPEEVGRSCSECGEALMNDIAYGLDHSQNLRNYVIEAHQNYANCIRDIQDGCVNTCGRQLYDKLPHCDRWKEAAGFRACVETTLTGAIASCP